jgi:predicted transcriptional regulator
MLDDNRPLTNPQELDITFNLTKEETEKLVQIARSRRMTLGEVVNEAIAGFLERHKE